MNRNSELSIPISPLNLMQCADWVARRSYGPDSFQARFVLLFAFITDSHKNDLGDTVLDWRVVAYPCDESGRVDDWRHRYDLRVSADKGDFNEVAWRLVFALANDLLPLQHIENE